MMKPNLGAVLLGSVTLVLLFSHARKITAILSVAAFASVNVILFLNHATLPDVIRSYLSVHRESSFFIQDFIPFGVWGISIPHVVGDSIVILVPLLAAFISVRRSRSQGKPLPSIFVILCACGILSGFAALATNMELFISEGALMILSAFLLLLRTENGTRWQSRLVFALTAGMIVYGLTLGAARVRVWLVGPPFMFHEVTPIADAGGQNPFFRGMTSGRNFQRTLAAMNEVVTEYPNARIFFDNTLAFGSAAFRKQSPTVDVGAREAATPRIWPLLLSVDALEPSDSVDVLVCSYDCKRGTQLGLERNDRLTMRATGTGTFLTDVFVYTRPGN
jgi:hypothetical protein